MARQWISPGGVVVFEEGSEEYILPDGAVISEDQAGGATAALTGTATASITEADIVTGGKTIILTLTGDTFVAAGTGPIGSTADTQAIIDGITSAQTETLGWNLEVRDKEVTTAVVRTSSTVATITLTAAAAYDITAQETITATIPAAALTLAAVVVAAPTFTVDTAGATTYFQTNTGSVTPAGGLTSAVTFKRAVTGSLTIAGAVLKKTMRSLSGSSTATGATNKKTSRLLAGSVTPTGALTPLVVLQQAVAGAITMVGGLVSLFSAAVAIGILRPVLRLVLRLVNRKV